MAYFDFSRPMGAGRTAGIFGQFIGMYAAWNDARKTRDALTRLNDRELNDLGLSRGDIDAIAQGIIR